MTGKSPFSKVRDDLSLEAQALSDQIHAEIEDALAFEDSREPRRREIAEDDERLLRRQAEFRLAADAVTRAFAGFSEVAAVALFGSVAVPLWREVPRFRQYRRARIELWHECKDVDLAVWIDRLDNLKALGRARNKAVARLHEETSIGVAHHQLDVFLMEPASNRYLGRLCWYSQCPKGKRECLVPGCGRDQFLQQHEDFTLHADALAEDRIIRLYDRASGTLRRAPEVPGAKLLDRLGRHE